MEGLCLVDELGHDGIDETEAVRGIWVLLGAGDGEERALGDTAEGRAACHGGRQVQVTRDKGYVHIW